MSIFKKYFDSPGRKNQDNSISIIDDLVLHDLSCLNESEKLDQQIPLVRASKLNANSHDEDYSDRTALHIGCQGFKLSFHENAENKGDFSLVHFSGISSIFNYSFLESSSLHLHVNVRHKRNPPHEQ